MSRFLKNATAYVGSNLVGQVCKVGQEFLLRRLLAPGLLGIWSLANVVQGFVSTFDLGITAASEREIALLQGASREGDALAARSTAFWSYLAQSAVLAICIVAYLLTFRRGESALVIAGYATGALLVLGSGVSATLMLFHSASLRYVSLSRALLGSSILSAVLLPTGAYLGGAWGLLAAGLVANACQSALVGRSARHEKLTIHRSWHRTIFRRLLAYGLPLRLADYPLSLFSVVDGMFVARFLGLEALAIYSTAKVVLVQAMDIPARLGNVLGMRLYNQTGASRNRGDLAEDLKRFLMVTYMALIPLIILGVSSVTAFAFGQFLPKYAPALPVMRKLLFAMYFVPNTSIVRIFWMIDGRLGALGLANIVGLLGLLASASLVLGLNGLSLPSVALSMVAGYALFFMYLMATIGREVWGLRGTLGLCLSVGLSVCVTALILRTDTPQVEGHALGAAFGVFGLNLSRELVLLSPMAVFAAWRARLLPYLQGR